MSAAGAFSLDLFAAAPMQLVDDAEGGIRYWPGFIEPTLARRWFLDLRANAAWRQVQRPMYDRVVEVPRLLAWYQADALPAHLPLAEMRGRVCEKTAAPYNSVGLNLYRDGNDSVAMHGDKMHLLVAPHPIALVSLGDPRRMLIRGKSDGGPACRQTLAIDLEPGSLLCMSHASQLTHEHGIPKTRQPQGPRISAVFRVGPAERRG